MSVMHFRPTMKNAQCLSKNSTLKLYRQLLVTASSSDLSPLDWFRGVDWFRGNAGVLSQAASLQSKPKTVPKFNFQ